MSTTPTLRDAAGEAAEILRDLIANIERKGLYSQESMLGFIGNAHALLAAALTQGAGAVEPVAFRMRYQRTPGMMQDYPWSYLEPEQRSKKPSPSHEYQDLYAAPPAQQLQQSVARALAPIQQAIRDYHYALDTRQHGGIAQINAFDAICGHLDMDWQPGQEAAIRSKGTHD